MRFHFPLGLDPVTGDIRRVPSLLEPLAAELERPRQATAQVVNHVVGTYGLTREELGAFITNELPKLEDYEIDLILSPLFTPGLRDQSIFADLLGRESVPAAQWPPLIQQLVARPTRAHLVTEDDQTHIVSLRDVTVERYVNRLRLDDAVELLKLVETYQPADVDDLLARIPHWQQVLRQEINEAGGAKPFFNERVQDLHGGGRDQRRQDNSRISAKEQERAFLERLHQVLSTPV